MGNFYSDAKGITFCALPAPVSSQAAECPAPLAEESDANLELMAELIKDSGSYGRVVYADYKSKQVQKRVQELNYMLADPSAPMVIW